MIIRQVLLQSAVSHSPLTDKEIEIVNTIHVRIISCLKLFVAPN
jgi:hypothetical protein